MRRRTTSTPLSPVEMTTCGIMAGLVIALGLLATVAPVLGGVLQVAAVLPVALVTVRMRPRAGVAAVVAAIAGAFAVGGALTAQQVAQCVVLGAIAGALLRRGAGRAARVAVALAVGAAHGAFIDLLAWLLVDLRTLTLDSSRAVLGGWVKILARIPGLGGIREPGLHLVDVFLDHWWVWIPVSTLLVTSVTILVAAWALRIVLGRLTLASLDDPLHSAALAADSPASEATPDAGPVDAPTVAPIPLDLRGVSHEYVAGRPALDGVDLHVGEGECLALVGPNGSGKSTLALLLAGALPTRGEVRRPGDVGLGRLGGTYVLAQRSELQVLGDTVREDVLWGLDGDELAEAEGRLAATLERVGLAGKEEDATENLSGGQLQRLALAGALVRRPRLLISDESTAMVDPAGRTDLVRLLTELPACGTSVVHITHDPSEIALFPRVVEMREGRVHRDTLHRRPEADTASAGAPVLGTPAPIAEGGARPAATVTEFGAPAVHTPHLDTPRTGNSHEHLWADRVTHVHDVGTPWATGVLANLSLIVSPGDAVLVTGDNGSGKSTLARILAGLTVPTWGSCTVGSRPSHLEVGRVALSMQFARLQLMRPTVASDILAATGRVRSHKDLSAADLDLARRALATVGLDGDLLDRSVDALSGGQMRRVALAGILAAQPDFLVLDEPFAGLDDASREALTVALDERRRAGLGLVVISHDTGGLEHLCDRHLVLEGGALR